MVGWNGGTIPHEWIKLLEPLINENSRKPKYRQTIFSNKLPHEQIRVS